MQDLLVGRYQRVGEIGRGGFGVVEEFIDLITGNTVAIKTIPPCFVQHESKRLFREVDIMRFLHNAHPHVIDFITMFVTRCRGGVSAQVSNPEPYTESLDVSGPFYEGRGMKEKAMMHHSYLAREVSTIQREESFSLHIVLPLMRGDLFYFINLLSMGARQRQHKLGEGFLKQVAAVFAFQLVFGLDWVHKCGIVHRDLKPDNILVRLNTDNAFYSSLCIADFGLARNMQSGDTFYVCTRNYRPPEIITSAILSQPSMDIWSLGCILYEMCTGKTLFKMPTALDSHGVWNGVMASSQLEVILSIVGTPSEEDIRRCMPEGNAKTYLLRSASRPFQLDKLMEKQWTLPTSQEETLLWMDLIKSCLAFFPQQRPTAEELSRHLLFVRYHMIVGSNIHQMKTRLYKPSVEESDLRNKMRQIGLLLQLVNDVMAQIRPLPKGEEESDEETFTYDEEYEDEVDWNDSRRSFTPSGQSSEIGNRGEEEDEGSGDAYTAPTWLRTQLMEQTRCSQEEDAGFKDRRVNCSLEPFEVYSQTSHDVPIDPMFPHLHGATRGPALEGHTAEQARRRLPVPMDGTLLWHDTPRGDNPKLCCSAGHSLDGGEPNYYRGGAPDARGDHPAEAGGELEPGVWRGQQCLRSETTSTPLSTPAQSNAAGSVRDCDDQLDKAPTAPFSTSVCPPSQNSVAGTCYGTSPHNDTNWTPYVYNQPYSNTAHAYGAIKPYDNPHESGGIDRRLGIGKDGPEDSKVRLSKKSPKNLAWAYGEAPLSPKRADLQYLQSQTLVKLEHAPSAHYTLSTASHREAINTNSDEARPISNAIRTKGIPFPDISDPVLRARYHKLEHTDDSLQAAIEMILGELNNNRRDLAISLELRALLSYFCALRGSR